MLNRPHATILQYLDHPHHVSAQTLDPKTAWPVLIEGLLKGAVTSYAVAAVPVFAEGSPGVALTLDDVLLDLLDYYDYSDSTVVSQLPSAQITDLLPVYKNLKQAQPHALVGTSPPSMHRASCFASKGQGSGWSRI
jgi:hypothetical protein